MSFFVSICTGDFKRPVVYNFMKTNDLQINFTFYMATEVNLCDVAHKLSNKPRTSLF